MGLLFVSPPRSLPRELCDRPVGQMASIHDVPATRIGGARLTYERAEGNVHARRMDTGQGMSDKWCTELFLLFSLLARVIITLGGSPENPH